MLLHNRISRKELELRLMHEPFSRATLSFYRYVYINNPQEFRDNFYKDWAKLNCFGRVYIAREGINAQMSVPVHHREELLAHLNSIPQLKDVPVKWAIEDDGKSFYKLTVKVRPKLVADGLQDDSFDVSNVGTHLTPIEFHHLMDQPDTLVVDMRNHYESEIGKFANSICAYSDTFSEGIIKVTELLQKHKDKKILLYCTGGIRCEKASAYLKHKGFKDVNQLYGGIIEYANVIRQNGLTSKFIGRNFVFDKRLGEDIDGTVISRCHMCGEPANKHTNCANNDCHLLYIQCKRCAASYDSCCSKECQTILTLPLTERLSLRKVKFYRYSKSKIFSRGDLEILEG